MPPLFFAITKVKRFTFINVVNTSHFYLKKQYRGLTIFEVDRLDSERGCARERIRYELRNLSSHPITLTLLKESWS